MKKFNPNKRTRYIINQILIILVVVIIGIISFLYHLFQLELKENLELNNVVSITYGVAIDVAIAIIPAIIWLLNIKKKFKKDLIDIYSLKEKIKYLRFDIRDINLGTEKVISLMLDPNIIDKTRDLLRKFDLFHDAAILNAFIDRKLLYQIDFLLIKVIKLTKSYDKGKGWNKLKNECYDAINELENLDDLDFTKEKLKQKFIENLDWVLAHELFFEKEGKKPTSYYYSNT